MYTGEIKKEYIRIRQFKTHSVHDQLKQIWENHYTSMTPVLVFSPSLNKGVWKKIALTNIYITVDSKGVDHEDILRKILAEKPNIIERMYLKIKSYISQKKTEQQIWWEAIPNVQTISI